MNPIRTVRGFARWCFVWRLKLQILFHFLPCLFGPEGAGGAPSPLTRGAVSRRLSPRQFWFFARRLLLFLSKLEHNKYVRIGERTRLDLYVPSFPSPAFYTGCAKFLEFAQPPPCITVLLSLTSACRFGCPHCYQRLDYGKDLPLDILLRLVRRLQDSGIAFFNLEGGEPFLVYPRLKAVCSAIDQRSEVWVNSTGDGMTLERLQELKSLNLTAVMFSLHESDPARLNAFMRSEKAWDILARGVGLCHQAGVPVAFNACLQPDAFRNGEFDRVMQRAREFNACLVQLIKPKPAGAWLDTGVAECGPNDLEIMTAAVNRYNHDPACADFPAVCAQILEEHAARFGCTAGGTDRFYVNAKGDVQPCEFLNVSFGNVLQEDFQDIYRRMRSAFSPPGETWLCESCAPEIRALAARQPRLTLPLGRETTEAMFAGLNRGPATRVYADIEKLK